MHVFHHKSNNAGPRLIWRLAGIIVIGALALAACTSAPSGTSATATGGVPQTGGTSAATSSVSGTGTPMATSAATTGSSSGTSGTGTPMATSAATTGSSSGASGTGTPMATTGASGAASSTSSASGTGTGTPSAAMAAPASVALTVKAANGNSSSGGTPVAGQYLADSKGMTLYIFKKDTPGVSNCSGQCAALWPPLLVAKGGQAMISGGGDTTKIGTITRADGATQVTYNNQPLYYFVKDKAPGDTTGQGVGGVWFVATP